MLTIVIPTKNEALYLPKLLDSIKAQTLPPLEIIVADANSTDQTIRLAEQAGCQVVAGGMPGAGRNRGAEVAQGELLLFLDADVILTNPHFLEQAMQEFEKRGLDFATCDVEPLSNKRFDRLMHQLYNLYVRVLANIHPHAPGFCIFARRTKHQQMNGFDETVTFCEDHDYVLRGSRIGTFGILRSVKISVSVRRLERDGRLLITLKYILAEFYILLFGPIRNNFFNYTFGHK